MQAVAEKSLFVESDVATWSDADYRRLLAELDPIFQAVPGDPTFDRSIRLVDLIEAGVVNNLRKTIDVGQSVCTFAMGHKAMYDFMDGNPAIESRPVDYLNNPHVIAQNDNVISINATIQIDLTGACNSEHMLGHQFSASGGQLDFVRGAYASKGGKSIIATGSTAAHGKVSKIVARLDGPVTTPRIDTHIVVTEYGWVNLKGMSSTERAKALIGLAHPQFRDELTEAAKKMFLL